MNPAQFAASGRSITLECTVCGSVEIGESQAGALCAVCAEGKLRWRLHAASRKSRGVRTSEFAMLYVREDRIERIASVAPKSTRTLPLDPTDDMLDALERSAESLKRRTPPAKVTVPKVAEPKVGIPTVAAPKVAAPKVAVPKVAVPKIPHTVKPRATKEPVASRAVPAVEPHVAGTVPPGLAAVASLVLPGVGQMLAGQFLKGILILALAVLLGFLLGLANIFAAMDAYAIAEKRRRGQVVGRWEMF